MISFEKDKQRERHLRFSLDIPVCSRIASLALWTHYPFPAIPAQWRSQHPQIPVLEAQRLDPVNRQVCICRPLLHKVGKTDWHAAWTLGLVMAAWDPGVAAEGPIGPYPLISLRFASSRKRKPSRMLYCSHDSCEHTQPGFITCSLSRAQPSHVLHKA